MGSQSRLTKRIEELERRVEALGEASASALIVEALVEMAGGSAAVGAKAAELAEAKEEAAEEQALATLAEGVEAGKLARAEVIGARSLVSARDGRGRLAVVAIPGVSPKVRAAWLGKKAGEAVDGFTIAEVYDLQRTKPREVPEAVSAARDALAGGKGG